MVKKATLLDKDNKYPFGQSRLLFATQHGKEEILKSSFAEIGFEMISVGVDTDLFGTFSGERDRSLSIREAMRAKIQLAQEQFPNERFFLASEGSFGPHPMSFMVKSDLESLLFVDKTQNVEIYAEHFTTEVVHEEAHVSKDFDLESLATQFRLASHAVIVRPQNKYVPIFKGIRDSLKLKAAIQECLSHSDNGAAVVVSDLRAHHNPTRQRAIQKAGEKLLESLLSFCPDCHQPGFTITSGIEGLPCEACGTPSRFYDSVIFTCPYCTFENITARPDGLKSIEMDQCEVCNP